MCPCLVLETAWLRQMAQWPQAHQSVGWNESCCLKCPPGIWYLGHTPKTCVLGNFCFVLFCFWFSLLSRFHLNTLDSASVSPSGIPIQWCIWIAIFCLKLFNYGPNILLATSRWWGLLPPSSSASYYGSIDPSKNALLPVCLDHQLQDLILLPYPLNYPYYIWLQ